VKDQAAQISALYAQQGQHQDKILEILEGQNKLMANIYGGLGSGSGLHSAINHGNIIACPTADPADVEKNKQDIQKVTEQIAEIFKKRALTQEDLKLHAENMLQLFKSESGANQEKILEQLKQELNESLSTLRLELEEMSKTKEKAVETAVEDAIKKLTEEEDPDYEYSYEVEYEDETEAEEAEEDEEEAEEDDHCTCGYEEDEDEDLDNSMIMELPEEIREAAREAGLNVEALNELIVQWTKLRHEARLVENKQNASLNSDSLRDVVRQAESVNKHIAIDRTEKRNHAQAMEKLSNEYAIAETRFNNEQTKMVHKASVDKKLAKEKRRTANKRDIAVSTVRAAATEKVLTTSVKWLAAGATVSFISWVAGTVLLAYFGG
jgi:hypothetical protein